MKILKNTFIIFLIIAIVIANFPVQSFAIENTEKILETENDYIKIRVNKEDGRFSIGTVEGSPYRDSDQNTDLLFDNGIPETSFATFRINGKDYIYGNNYGFMSFDGQLIESPTNNGLTNQSKWKIEDIEISQHLELIENKDNRNAGNVRITYEVKNTGDNQAEIGSRILLDAMLGKNDGVKIYLSNKDLPINRETDIYGEEIPDYWKAMDSIENPQVVAYGLLNTLDIKPDRMVIAHWNAISETKWDYTINESRQIISNYNEYESSDTAVALYWNPVKIEPGASYTFETYYGLGDVRQQTGDANFKLNIYAPDKLTPVGSGYLENEFTIIAEIDNTINDSTNLYDIVVKLQLPKNIELAKGQESSKYFSKISKNTVLKTEWKVKPKSSNSLKMQQYIVNIISQNDSEKLKTKKQFIILPSVGRELPEVSYHDFIPKTLHYMDENKSILILGSGFEILKNLDNWQMFIKKSDDETKYFIKKEDITVISDNEIAVRIAETLEVGDYIINIEHDTLDNFTFTSTLEISDDGKYISRSYDLIAICKDPNSGIYSIKSFTENEISSANWNNENIELLIRGKINQIEEENRYEIIPIGGIVEFNNILQYKGNSIYINKNDIGVFELTGSGKLFVETKFIGKEVDITLHEGPFKVAADELNIQLDDSYIYEDNVLNLGAMPVTITDIRFDGNGEVNVDGDLNLPLDRMSYLFNSFHSEDCSTLLDNIGIDKNGINVDKTISLPFPSWKVGSFQSKENKISLIINTIDGEYGIGSRMKNQKLRLNDIYAELLFNNSFIPENFKFSNNYNIPEPIGSTGLGFDRISGEIDGVSNLFSGNYYDISIIATCDICDLPTNNFRINGNTLFNSKNFQVMLTLEGINFVGSGRLYSLEIAEVNGDFKYTEGGSLTAALNIGDIIVAQAYLSITSNNFECKVNGSIYIPGWVPLVGGEEAAGFEAGVNTEKIYGSIKVIGIEVSVAYYFRGADFDFDVATLDNNKNNGLYVIDTQDEYGRNIRKVYGANIERVDKYDGIELCYDGNISELRLLTDASKLEHDINISGIENALLEIEYEGDIPNIEVIMPNGSYYNLRPISKNETNPNYKIQIIPADISQSGIEEKYIYISIIDPMEGTWKINSDNNVAVSLLNVKDIPKFTDISCEKIDNHKVKVGWELTSDKDAIVSLYLAKDTSIGEILLADNIDASLGELTVEIPEDTLTGEYYIYAKVTREDYGYDSGFSNGFNIIDSLAPALPTRFKVSYVGNGVLEAKWDLPEDDIDGWYIHTIDDEGNTDLEKGDILYIEKGQNSVKFGGVYKDENGNEYGFITDEEYQFSLTAVRTDIDGDKEMIHYSEQALSEKVFLPSLVPPVINAILTTPIRTLNMDYENGIGYINDDILYVYTELDKNGDTTIYLNNDEISKFSGTSGNCALNLKNGENIIRILSKGDNGDEAVKTFSVISDTEAPYLMIESPVRGQMADNGKIKICGKTGTNTILMIDGETFETFDNEGCFETTIDIGNVMKKIVTITAKDLAGNTTTYEAEVWNDYVKEINAIKIKPEINEIQNGTTQLLSLNILSEGGKELVIDPSLIEWELIGEEGIASISQDGLLKTYAVGDVIIKGSYYVTEKYCWEDAVLVKIIPNEGMITPIEEDETNEKKKTKKHLYLGIISIDEDTRVDIYNELKLKIPKNSLVKKGYLQIFEILDKNKYVSNLNYINLVSDLYDIKFSNESILNNPVELTIYYNKNKVKNINKLGIYYYNEEESLWELIGGKIDKENHCITVCIDHFSKYAVLENDEFIVMNDMENHWAKNAVNRLVLKGIINGFKISENEFIYNPNEFITRAELAKLLATLMDINTNDNISSNIVFDDNSMIPEWARPYILYCYEKGWIKGKLKDDKLYFNPNETITRAEVVTMIGRTLLINEYNENCFVDKKDIPSWATKYINILSKLELINGYPDNSFRPKNKMTRAEAAALIDKYLRNNK